MTLDYWSWIEGTEIKPNEQQLQRIEQKLRSDLRALERQSLSAEELKKRKRELRRAAEQEQDDKRSDMLALGAGELAYYRRFERSALAVARQEALGDEAVDKRAAQRFKDAYKRGFTRPVEGGAPVQMGVPRQVRSLAAGLGLLPEPPDMMRLPAGSVFWQVPFALRSDYLSKDDVSFYVEDNPVRKDHVLKLPMIAAPGWKGALRAAFRQRFNLHDDPDGQQDKPIPELFGTAREDEAGEAGALHFFPTFFDRIGLRVINPHDRATGTGKLPIPFETVPAGTPGNFHLLYLPVTPPHGRQVASQINNVTAALRAMFSDYGFGAKTSAGMGRAVIHPSGGALRVRLAAGVESREFNSFQTLKDAAASLADAVRQKGAL